MIELYKGLKIIHDGISAEIVSVGEDNIEVIFHSINDKYYNRYVDIGKVYPMVLNHSEEDDDNVDDINCSYRVYEIESQYMKSDYCQLVLFVDEEMICF